MKKSFDALVTTVARGLRTRTRNSRRGKFLDGRISIHFAGRLAARPLRKTERGFLLGPHSPYSGSFTRRLYEP